MPFRISIRRDVIKQADTRHRPAVMAKRSAPVCSRPGEHRRANMAPIPSTWIHWDNGVLKPGK